MHATSESAQQHAAVKHAFMARGAAHLAVSARILVA
jgi:hypothetical protein